MPDKLLPVIQEQPSIARDASPPIFHRIGIVGLGLIGGSIALAARRAWPAALVIGVDRKDVLERAMLVHAVDVGADDLVMLREADLVILAAPIEQNMHVLTELASHVSGEAVITDTGSTKRGMMEAARALPARLTFVGGHPLGGAAVSGIEHARLDLFAGRPWLLTTSGDASGDALTRLSEFVHGLGAEPRVLDADTHDRLLAAVSHLPQLVVSALMHVVGERAGEDGLGLSGFGLQDTTRLASSPAGIWKDVCRTNPDYIAEALDALIAVLSEMKNDLRRGEALERVFESANVWKASMPARGRDV